MADEIVGFNLQYIGLNSATVENYSDWLTTEPVKPKERKLDNMIRQGDVLLVEVTEIPSNARPIKRDKGRLVLAYGEATGHTHVLDAPPEEATLLTNKEGERFLRLMTAAPLVHEEHDPLIVEPGLYRQIPQEEWADSKNLAEPAAPRRVID